MGRMHSLVVQAEMERMHHLMVQAETERMHRGGVVVESSRGWEMEYGGGSCRGVVVERIGHGRAQG
jgi:hypothetical protein